VPEFAFGGCWPLWPQFAPDELSFRCRRSWTADPGDRISALKSRLRDAPLPCWQTCWRPTNGNTGGERPTNGNTGGGRPTNGNIGGERPTDGNTGGEVCTAACPPAAEAVPARVWWEKWKKGLVEFGAGTEEGRAMAAARAAFIGTNSRSVDDMVAKVF